MRKDIKVGGVLMSKRRLVIVILFLLTALITNGCLAPEKMQLKVGVEGQGLITKNPDDSGKGYPKGASVELVAVATDGWEFQSWSGDITSTNSTVVVKMDKHKHITAKFIEVEKPEITVEVSLDAITISWQKNSDNIAGYNIGRSLIETDEPTKLNTELIKTNSYIDTFFDQSNEFFYFIASVDKNNQVSTWFGPIKAKRKHSVTVAVSGNGSIIKTPDDSGLGYYFDEDVYISGIPDKGYKFVQWQGDYEGTEQTIKLPMNSSKNLIAIFKPLGTLRVPDEYVSIQAAIDAAEEGETILVAPGIYKENLDLKGKRNITLSSTFGIGTSDINATVIDGSNSGPCIIANQAEENIKIIGFTLTNGSGFVVDGITKGGAIYADDSNLELISNQFKQNNAVSAGNYAYGGAIYALSSSITLSSNSFIDNQATSSSYNAFGGAIAAEGTTLNLIDKNYFQQNIVKGKASSFGGAIYAFASNVSINNDEFISNAASWIYPYAPSQTFGGALFIDGSSTLSLTGTIIEKNEAAKGGGLSIKNSVATINNSTLVYNHANAEASGFGGAIYAEKAKITLQNNLIIYNKASSNFSTLTVTRGGAIYASNCDLEMVRNTLDRNEAHVASGDPLNSSKTYGGAIFAVLGKISLIGNSFTNNMVKCDVEFNDFGGAIAIEEIDAIIEFNIFSDNVSTCGSGIWSKKSNITNIIGESLKSRDNLFSVNQLQDIDDIYFDLDI